MQNGRKQYVDLIRSTVICSLCSSTQALLIHRSALITALQAGFESYPHYTVHTSARLVSYMRSSDVETGSPITLHFADGTTATADVVIGADGIRSAVRSTMFEGSSTGPRPKWTGTIVYRSLIQREALDAIWTNHRATRSLTIVRDQGWDLFCFFWRELLTSF